MSGISNKLDGLDLGLPDFSQPATVESSPKAKRSADPVPAPKPSPASDHPSPQVQPVFQRWLWTTVPSWMISMFVHVAVILVLAGWNLEPIRNELRMMLVSSESTSDAAVDDLSMDQSMATELVSTESDEAPSDHRRRCC
jgi:hypothetical protein